MTRSLIFLGAVIVGAALAAAALGWRLELAPRRPYA
jgi:hypothetical protein